MRSRLLSAFVILVAVCGIARAQPAPPAPAAQQRVVLTWSESSLDDAAYTRLVTAIANDVPRLSWPTARVRDGEGLETLVDRLYDFYKVGTERYARPLPQTVDALIDLIAKENQVDPAKLTAGDTLRVPPVPVRAKTIETGATPLRFFDPRTKGVAVVDRSSVVLPRAGADAERDGTSTAVSLSASAAREVSDLGEVTAAPPPPPPGAPVAAGLAQVELLQRPCPVPTIPARSPFLLEARAALKAKLPRLRELASKRKLGFVDFNFTDGHGAKVRSAAKWLLNELEVGELSNHFKELDLEFTPGEPVPTRFQETLAGYLQANPNDVKDSAIRDAWYWFFAPSRNPDIRIRTVPELLLQAAISKQLREVAWLNLSWQVSGSASEVLPVDLPNLVGNRMVVVAAGNDSTTLPPERKPQAAAATRLQFANVTHGSEEGDPYGTTTNPTGGRVEVMAPGCGYTYEKLVQADSGSSFAAPIVAAASWLKHLLDNVSASEMRVLLSRASTLVPPKQTGVLAGGVFDPARLIVGPGAHYVDRATRTAVRLTDVQVVTDACGTFGARPGRPPGSQQLIAYAEGQTWYVVHRWEESRLPFVRVEDKCAVRTLAATGKINGQAWSVGTPEQFAQTVTHLAF